MDVLKLMILESGAKAKTVKKYLGKGWLVEACNGHVQDLPSNGHKQSSKAMWAAKEGELPEPPWSWTERGEKNIKAILARSRKAGVDEVYIATDPDREGEFIAWRLSILFSEFETQKRVTFNEITESSVKLGLDNATSINQSLVDAAKVRRFMDRLVGYRCSRFSRSWKLASMGRVQTPTLGFIVERELEREAHVPIDYHSVSVISDDVTFKVRFHEKNDEDAWTDDDGKHHPDRTFDEKLATRAHEAITKAGSLNLTGVKEGKNKRKPKPPFTTDTLLQSASSTFGWSVSKTSRLAGSLYQSGHVTYIRTDSTRTNADAREKIRSFIEKEFGEDHLGKGALGPDAKKGSSNVQDAHEAIRPTRPESQNITGVEPDEMKLYGLIWARFAASQMSDSIRERRDITAEVTDFERPIYGTASWRIKPGWEAVYTQYQSNVRTTPPKSGLNIGDNWGVSIDEGNPTLTSDSTKPPRRYSESSIIQEMKKAGIGRPSTYVPTINRLSSRKYVLNESGSLIPTEDGRTMWIDVVPFYNDQENNSGLFNTEFTADMEKKLDGIEHNNISAPDIWHEFVNDFRAMHNNALESRRSKPTPRQISFLNNRIRNLNQEQKESLLGSKKVEELTGDEIREILEKLNEDGSEYGEMPASEKQMNLIIKLCDQLSIELSEAAAIVESNDINSLTGGKNGSASKLITILIEKSRKLPATEPQVNLVKKLAEQTETPLSDVLTIANLVSIDEMSKSDASVIINTMMKKQKQRKSKKK